MSTAERLWRRVQHAVGFARTTTATDESATVASVQVKVNDLKTIDAVPVLQHFGLQTSLPIGTDVVIVSPAGDTTNSVVVATNHQPSRKTGVPAGGTRLYDQGGREVLLANDGLIALMAPGEVLHKLMTEVAMQVYNSHTHPTPSGTSGVPNQQMTDADLTTATRAGT